MVTLTQRAQQRLVVLNALDRGEMVMAAAAALVGLSIRHLRRLRQAYRRRGARALVHGNRGRPSPRRVSAAIRTRIITLARTTYAGVNHQHLTELLAEHNAVVLSHPTVHRILRAAGLRSPRRRRPPKHRQRRERMRQAGLLVQMDGSHHPWLQDRGPALVLLHAIDDATGMVLGAVFREREDAAGYLLLLRRLVTTHGIPVAVYTDWHGIFKRTPRAPLTLEEQLRGEPAPTQVGRTLAELSIQWIPASSPQAKGRVERVGGTFQDRLVSELRLAGVRDLAGANAFLPTYIARHNRRFARPAAEHSSAFRPLPAALDLNTICCFKYLRTAQNDNTVSLGPHHLQILPDPRRRSFARARVEVHERLDGTLAVFTQGHQLTVQVLTSPPRQSIPARHLRRVRPIGPGSVQALREQKRLAQGNHRPKGPRRPPPDHPWRQEARNNVWRRELRKAGGTLSLKR
jgi:transposase